MAIGHTKLFTAIWYGNCNFSSTYSFLDSQAGMAEMRRAAHPVFLDQQDRQGPQRYQTLHTKS